MGRFFGLGGPRHEKLEEELYVEELGQEVALKRSARRTVSISLSPDGRRIRVGAPLTLPPERIRELIATKQNWIEKKQRELQQRKQATVVRSYENGAPHLLLGRVYPLRIEEHRRKGVELTENELVVYVQSADRVARTLREWYAKQAILLLPDIISPSIVTFHKRHGVMPRSISYRHVTSYWGVCTTKGDIRLNINLVRAPKAAIEYIITHELCHLLHHNHSRRFYDLLTEEMPDWKERKKLLGNTLSCRE